MRESGIGWFLLLLYKVVPCFDLWLNLYSFGLQKVVGSQRVDLKMVRLCPCVS